MQKIISGGKINQKKDSEKVFFFFKLFYCNLFLCVLSVKKNLSGTLR